MSSIGIVGRRPRRAARTAHRRRWPRSARPRVALPLGPAACSGSRFQKVTESRPNVSRTRSSRAFGTGRCDRGSLGSLPPQHRAGQGGQDLRLGAGPRGLPGAPRREVHHHAHRHRHDDERGEREHVLPLGDRELVERRREVVVEQQRAERPRRARRAQPADQGDPDHRAQEQQDVAGQVDSSRRRVASSSVSSGQPDDGQHEAGESAARRSAAAPRRGPGARWPDLLVGDHVHVDGAGPRGGGDADPAGRGAGRTGRAGGRRARVGWRSRRGRSRAAPAGCRRRRPGGRCRRGSPPVSAGGPGGPGWRRSARRPG